MTAPGPRRPRRDRLRRRCRGLSRAIAGLLLLAGIVAAVGGVGYAVAGAIQAPDTVTVPISIEADNGGPLRPTPVSVDGVVLPDGARLQVDQRGLQLVTETGDAHGWTGFLARGDAALLGLGFGACALLLVPVVSSVAAGDPFRRSNAARIGWTGAVVGVVGTVAPMLPNIAAVTVMRSFDAASGTNPFAVSFGIEAAPIGIAALIFVVAEAFRRGTQISDDTAGLV